MSQISEDGSYWNIVDNATKKENISESFYSLSEVLMDCTIKEVVSKMFSVPKDPGTWSDTIKAYAFGKGRETHDQCILYFLNIYITRSLTEMP